jgi:hypothetical protein
MTVGMAAAAMVDITAAAGITTIGITAITITLMQQAEV